MSASEKKDQEQFSKTSASAVAPPASTSHRPKSIYLVAYPKIVFLYPTFLTALVAAVLLGMTGRNAVGPDDLTAVITTWIFLAVAGINIMVLAFDFPRTTSLTVFFLVVALVMGGILAFTLKPDLLPTIGNLLKSIRPAANATFFGLTVVVLSLVFIAVFISLRFDYWEVRPNELLHHHGFLSDLKRFSAPSLRIDKEINDVFEYLLLGSGRLILQPSGEKRAIILDNVLFITKKEAAITQMLGALQVEVRPDAG